MNGCAEWWSKPSRYPCPQQTSMDDIRAASRRVAQTEHRSTGTLVEWNDDRGFGFVESTDGTRVFCHVKAFAVRVRRPMLGDRLTYTVVQDVQGRLSATSVRPVGLEDARYNANVGRKAQRSSRAASPSRRAEKSRAFPLALVGVASFVVLLTYLGVTGRISPVVPLGYLVISAVTIAAYAFDKSAAMNGRWRTQEQTLHLLELAGGWPGAWFAQALFRHKSRKTSFMIEFWFCVAFNVAALLWYAGFLPPQMRG